MFKFSNSSKQKLSTCDPDLQSIFNLAIKRSKIDFGIAEGHRSIERQKELFAEGKTTIDGVTQKSQHNFSPSLAVDIYAYFNGSASWDEKHLCYIAGVVQSCAVELGFVVRWGGNWDSDGVIVYDQNFIDLPHFEIKK